MNFFVKNNQIKNDFIFITNSDVNHIKNVLRKMPGDLIDVVCDEYKYKAKIEELEKDFIKCSIIDKTKFQNEDFKLTIFQGLAKADKIEYIIQKCTEIGVYEIIPTEMKRCVVKLDEKDKLKKIDRWQKIAEVASKQSLRNDILKINKILNFNQMCVALKSYDCLILAYEKENDTMLKSVIRNDIKKYKNIAVIVGPEGGIDDDEAEKLINIGAKSVSLGKRILRTETAPIAISAIIMYEADE